MMLSPRRRLGMPSLVRRVACRWMRLTLVTIGRPNARQNRHPSTSMSVMRRSLPMTTMCSGMEVDLTRLITTDPSQVTMLSMRTIPLAMAVAPPSRQRMREPPLWLLRRVRKLREQLPTRLIQQCPRLQRGGAFPARGPCQRVLRLTTEARRQQAMLRGLYAPGVALAVWFRRWTLTRGRCLWGTSLGREEMACGRCFLGTPRRGLPRVPRTLLQLVMWDLGVI